MARLLLGWELGGNRGHMLRVAEIARRLHAGGHEVVIAAQRLSPTFELPAEIRIMQAPIWPRLLASVAGGGGPAPQTMGDILVRLGLDDPGTLPALIGAWREIFSAVRPDAVIADFAPALLTAARGRVPTVAVGSGFDCVPAHLQRFPSLTGQPAAFDESQALAALDRTMTAAGLDRVDRLPQLFAADRVLAGVFAELDCYVADRSEPVVAPSVTHPVGAAGEGEEIFLYADAALLRTGPLWEGLVRSALPVRVYAQGASATQHAELEKLGFQVERAPVPFERIAARSRLAMSYGGMGFVSSALAAGVPNVIIHYDLEKAHTGQAITRLQLGGHGQAAQIKPDAFATALRQLYTNDSFQRRARELAPDFRARLSPSQEELAVTAVEELLA